MFEVTGYEPPHVFVTKRQTGETYKLLVENDGAVNDETFFDQGDARRAAINYLAQRARANAVLSKT
jgi:hypothetical protein